MFLQGERYDMFMIKQQKLKGKSVSRRFSAKNDGFFGGFKEHFTAGRTFIIKIDQEHLLPDCKKHNESNG